MTEQTFMVVIEADLDDDTNEAVVDIWRADGRTVTDTDLKLVERAFAVVEVVG